MGQDERSLVNWTQLIYVLHALSLLTGILGAAPIIGAFLTGWPSIIAVVLNYVKRGDVRVDLVHLPRRARLDGAERRSSDVRQRRLPHG